MLSTPIKRSAKLTGLAIVLVCAFAASLYYVIPDSPRAKSIAFALGPTSTDSVNSSVYSLGTILNVTFQNGTTWEISGYPNIAKEFNSTEISQILVLPPPRLSRKRGWLEGTLPYPTPIRVRLGNTHNPRRRESNRSRNAPSCQLHFQFLYEWSRLSNPKSKCCPSAQLYTSSQHNGLLGHWHASSILWSLDVANRFE